MTWTWWMDCFIYLLHGLLTKHEVVVDLAYVPVKPSCRTCRR